jgi:hypothetical protein
VTVSCKYGDELAGSGATDLVIMERYGRFYLL